MQSADYVPGVSGWKIANGLIEVNNCSRPRRSMITVTLGDRGLADLPKSAIGQVQFMAAQNDRIPQGYEGQWEIVDDAPESGGSDIRLKLTYQRLESLDEVAIRSAHSESSVVLCPNGDITVTSVGRLVARWTLAGLSEGVDQKTCDQSDAKAATGRAIERGEASEVLRSLATQITESNLGHALKLTIRDPDEAVREVLRQELRPGGLLHRR